ncbi:MAG: hypothetical protein ACLT2F_10725, partial [Butyricicoccus sp.]
PCTVQCLGGLLDYLEQTQKASLSSLNQLQVYHQGQYMELDLIARRNLELCETMRTKEKKGTLLWVLDHTRTAMGSRLIRQWIEKPLYNPLHIARRQQAVGALCDDVIARTALTDALKRVFVWSACWARSQQTAVICVRCRRQFLACRRSKRRLLCSDRLCCVS